MVLKGEFTNKWLLDRPWGWGGVYTAKVSGNVCKGFPKSLISTSVIHTSGWVDGTWDVGSVLGCRELAGEPGEHSGENKNEW